MQFDPYTLAGIFGAAFIIVAYFANQSGWLRSEDWRFPTANIIGACLILVSLYTAWNLPSAVIEGFWVAISLYGLARSRWLGRNREAICQSRETDRENQTRAR